MASLNTPLFKVDPSVPSSEKLKDIPIFDYQLYFQTPVSQHFENKKMIYEIISRKLLFSKEKQAKIWFLSDALDQGSPDTDL